MIENTALRAIIAGGVGLVVWKVLEMLLVGSRQAVWYYLWGAFLLGAVAAVLVFFGLARPKRRVNSHP